MREIFHLLYVLSTLANMSLNEVVEEMKKEFNAEEKLYD